MLYLRWILGELNNFCQATPRPAKFE